MEIAQTVAISAPDGPAPAPQAGIALAGLFTHLLAVLLGMDAGKPAGVHGKALQVMAATGDHAGHGRTEGRQDAATATLPAVPPDVVASRTAPDGEAPRAPDTTGTAGDEAAAPEEAAIMAVAFCEGAAPGGGARQAIDHPGRQPCGRQSEAASTGATPDGPGPFVAPDRSMSPGMRHTGPTPTAGLPAGAERLPPQAGAVAGANVAMDREIPHGAEGRVERPAAGAAPVAGQPGRSPLAPAGTEDAVLAVQTGARAALLAQAGETRPAAGGPQEAPVLALAGASAVGAQTGKPSLQPPAQGTNFLPEAKTAPTGPPAAGGAQSPPPTPGQDVAAGHRAAPTDGMPEAGPKALPAQNTQPLSLADAGPLLLQAGLRTGTGTAAGMEIPGGPQGAVGQTAAGVPGPRAGLEDVAGDRFRDTPTGLREKAVAGPLNGPAPVTAATPPAGPQPLTAQLAVAVVRHIEQLRQQPGRPLRLEIALEPPELGRVTVRLTLVRGELTAQFYTGDASARDALAASLPQLREALAQHNIWLGQAHVFLGQDGRAGHAPYTWTGRGFGPGPGGGAEAPVPEANTRPDYDARLLNYLV